MSRVAPAFEWASETAKADYVTTPGLLTVIDQDHNLVMKHKREKVLFNLSSSASIKISFDLPVTLI